MNLKTLAFISQACYAGAAMAAAVAFAAFRAAEAPWLAWSFVFLGAFFAFIGARAQSTGQTLQEGLRQRQYQVELVQAELDEQRLAVDVLADGLDIAVFICDPKAIILYANKMALDLFHFTNPVGRSLLAVTLSYDLEQIVLGVAKSGEPNRSEINFTYPGEHVGLVKAWPQSPGGRVFLSVYNITDLRRLERVRQDFVSNVSHELRTPLTIIRAMSETLLDELEKPEEKQQRYLEKIISEVDRLSMISNDLLILSASESNPVRKQDCDLADVFSSVTKQLEPMAKAKGISLTYEGPEHLIASANSAQMTQVALNLVENAINYTMEGSIHVSVAAEGEEVLVKVKDTGLGIASDHLPRIFERFYRVDKGRGRASGGTGLGLSIVKHIVEAHGGRVLVESALHEGSTFTVALPKEIAQ